MLHLLIPNLPSVAARAPRLPVLETLLARATRRPLPAPDWQALLADVFNLPVAALSPAPFAYLADTGIRDAGCRLCADPVSLVADRDQLVMLDSGDLKVTTAEAQALATSINALYREDGLVLETPAASRWYLRVPSVPDCTSHDPAGVMGGPVLEFMPAGREAAQLKRWMNEIQMLLHEHPVNQAREATGQPLINSVWLWGGGSLPKVAPQPDLQVMSNLPLVRGLAQAAGSPCTAWPGALDGLLAADRAVVAVKLSSVDELLCLERDVARALHRALRQGAVKGVWIYPGGDSVYELSRANLIRFWRHRRALARQEHGV